jgi:hypothetical protein
MFSSEATACYVGPPAIAIEALSELRDLLSSLQKSTPCDKALATSLSQEEKREMGCTPRLRHSLKGVVTVR